MNCDALSPSSKRKQLIKAALAGAVIFFISFLIWKFCIRYNNVPILTSYTSEDGSAKSLEEDEEKLPASESKNELSLDKFQNAEEDTNLPSYQSPKYTVIEKDDPIHVKAANVAEDPPSFTHPINGPIWSFKERKAPNISHYFYNPDGSLQQFILPPWSEVREAMRRKPTKMDPVYGPIWTHPSRSKTDKNYEVFMANNVLYLKQDGGVFPYLQLPSKEERQSMKRLVETAMAIHGEETIRRFMASKTEASKI